MDATRPLVKLILEYPLSFSWTTQGLGMLRTYIEPELRLHVWNSQLQFKDASKMHTHPWNFHSLVVAGRVRQYRYEPSSVGQTFRQQEILCGAGGGLVGQPQDQVLERGEEEVYEAGQVYSQLAHEIHASHPEDGTVTLIKREFLDDADHALVFWEPSGEWVTAEPRRATYNEIYATCGSALEKWF